MKKVLLFLLTVVALAACTKCDDPGTICTDELRMIPITVQSTGKSPIALDSVYTIRQSNNERIMPQQPGTAGYYVVLDDSYQPKLKNKEDNFRFVGWRNSQVVVDQVFRIAGDKCHISKRSGADTAVVQ